ncbi:MAG: hypothetical protein ACJAZS_000037 [Alteromonas naphthalenivorans]|jgi:hypothetical protein
MKKLLLTILLLAPFFSNASPHCTSWERKDFKTGVIHSNAQFHIDDCSCHCNGPRTEKNICLECGHGHSQKPFKEELENDVDDVEGYFDKFKDYAVDLVTTITGNR